MGTSPRSVSASRKGKPAPTDTIEPDEIEQSFGVLAEKLAEVVVAWGNNKMTGRVEKIPNDYWQNYDVP